MDDWLVKRGADGAKVWCTRESGVLEAGAKGVAVAWRPGGAPCPAVGAGCYDASFSGRCDGASGYSVFLKYVGAGAGLPETTQLVLDDGRRRLALERECRATPAQPGGRRVDAAAPDPVAGLAPAI